MMTISLICNDNIGFPDWFNIILVLQFWVLTKKKKKEKKKSLLVAYIICI